MNWYGSRLQRLTRVKMDSVPLMGKSGGFGSGFVFTIDMHHNPCRLAGRYSKVTNSLEFTTHPFSGPVLKIRSIR